MSILVKGWKMPESCCECPCCDSVDLDCRITCDKVPWDIKDERKPVWCPLIEIPPHGNLIDKLELCHALKNRWKADDCSAFDILNTTYNLFAHIVLQAPTVIEAEEAET